MSTGILLKTTIVLLALLVITSGCENDSSQVAQVAQEAARRQGEQSLEMARLNREIAAGTKRLVDGQADAAQHWQTMEQKVHEQRDELESERRQQAETRQRDSLLAPVLVTLGVLLLCCLALLICWQLLARLANETQETTITQLLLDEVICQSRLPHQPGGALTAREELRAPEKTDSSVALLPDDPDEGQESCRRNKT
jgi:hypothetical protein